MPGPCGDCEGDNAWEIVEVFEGGTITRDITEVCTPCTTYRLIAFANGINASGSAGAKPTDDAPVTGWIAEYSFSGSTTADPAYSTVWDTYHNRENAPNGTGAAQGYEIFTSQRMVFYPLPSGTVVAHNLSSYEAVGFAVVLVKGGRVAAPNWEAETQGGIAGTDGGGDFSYISGADWDGVAAPFADSLVISWRGSKQATAANCGISNFGRKPDGDALSFPNMTEVASATDDAFDTSYPPVPPCIPSDVLIPTAVGSGLAISPTTTFETGLTGVRPGFGAEAGWAYYESAECGAPVEAPPPGAGYFGQEVGRGDG